MDLVRANPEVARFDPRSPGSCVKVPLGRTLNPKLPLVIKLAPHMAAAVLDVHLIYEATNDAK